MLFAIGVTASKTSPRDLMRQLSASSAMPTVYQATGVFWDTISQSQYRAPLNFLLPFEMLQCLVPEGEESQWAECTSDCMNAEIHFESLCGSLQLDRGGCDSDLPPLGGFGVWGDSAPYKHRDSLYLTLWNLTTGPCRRRFWFTVFPKRSVCMCGCSGRCTFEPVWEVLTWASKVIRCMPK